MRFSCYASSAEELLLHILPQMSQPPRLPHYKHNNWIKLHTVYMLLIYTYIFIFFTVCCEVCPQNAPREMPKDVSHCWSGQHKAEPACMWDSLEYMSSVAQEIRVSSSDVVCFAAQRNEDL